MGQVSGARSRATSHRTSAQRQASTNGRPLFAQVQIRDETLSSGRRIPSGGGPRRRLLSGLRRSPSASCAGLRSKLVPSGRSLRDQRHRSVSSSRDSASLVQGCSKSRTGASNAGNVVTLARSAPDSQCPPAPLPLPVLSDRISSGESVKGSLRKSMSFWAKLCPSFGQSSIVGSGYRIPFVPGSSIPLNPVHEPKKCRRGPKNFRPK